MWRDYPPGAAQALAGAGLGALVLIALIAMWAGGDPDEPTYRVSVSDRLALHDFDRGAAGWRLFDLGAAAFEWDDETGTLAGRVDVERGHVTTSTSTVYRDVVITATVVAVVPPGTTASVGITCRADADGNGIYFLVTEGAASIRRGSPDEPDDLVPLVNWTRTDAVRPLREGNTLRAVCASDYMALSVNGVYLLQAEDTTFSRGFAGVALAGGLDGRRETARISATWDDFTVTEAARLTVR